MFAAALVCALGLAAGSGVARADGTLLADWQMTAGDGQVVADASGNGHAGRLGESPLPDSADPDWVNGVGGMSGLRFFGGQYVAVPDSDQLAPPQLSVEAWVRADGSPGIWRYVLSKGALGCERAAYGLYSGWFGGLAFYVSSETAYTLTPEAPASLVWDGAWHHVVGSYDGLRTRLFVDGAEVGAGTVTPEPIAYGPESRGVYLGAYRGSCLLGFAGDIARVRIWDGPVPAPAGPPPTPRPPITPVPNSPTSVPVGPAPPPGEPAGSPVAKCLSVRVGRAKLRRGKRARLDVRVRRGKRAAHRARVVASGAGVRLRARTNRRGRVTLVVRPRARGKLRITIAGQPRACGAATVRVR
jgi:hypothetical protein